MKVKKYNRKTQEFDKSKIEESIRLAAKDAKEDIPEFMVKRMAQAIEDDLILDDVITISAEELAKLVENKLMASSYKDTAWHYITYHYDRQKEHLYNSDLIKAFKKKLSGKNIENSNANCDERSFSGRMKEAANVLFKDEALNMMNKVARQNHLNNLCYTHDADSYASGQHNCFDRNTAFITNMGIRTFNNFTDGEPVTVLAGDGKWREAIVHNYGHKKTQRVELEYSNSKKDKDTIVVECTKDHRWYLKDGSVTTNLQVGDKLQALPYIEDFDNITIETKEDAEMWCLGFIIGDGCDHYNDTQVMLYGDKIKYKENFEKAYYRITDNEDKVLCVKRLAIQKQPFLTNKLWKMLSLRQKQLLFNGYLCADGNHIRGTINSVCTADERILEFIQDISCLSGYHIRRVTHKVHDTNYKKNAQIWTVDFFTNQNYHNVYWYVKSITPNTHNNSSVWCVEEPVTKSFTLAGGVITGNCLSIPFDPLLLYGIITKQTDIRQPKSIQTACQLIAVIIQIQSLQQFGGVSATHLDWTLVPYVRHSFFKHLRDGHKYICKDVFVIPDNCYELSIDDYKDDPVYEYALDLTIRDAKQGAEGLIHNLNSLQSRSGQQLPFSSINFGTCTLTEGRIMSHAILDAELDGTGPLHKTPIFPCSIFQYHKDINGKPGTPNYDLFRKALYCTSKRLYPNYCNCSWSVNVNATNKDIAHKKAVLSKLSKENMTKLTEWVKNNANIAINYRMKVENDTVVIDENVLIPVEIMSTMGKCKLQLI